MRPFDRNSRFFMAWDSRSHTIIDFKAMTYSHVSASCFSLVPMSSMLWIWFFRLVSSYCDSCFQFQDSETLQDFRTMTVISDNMASASEIARDITTYIEYIILAFQKKSTCLESYLQAMANCSCPNQRECSSRILEYIRDRTCERLSTTFKLKRVITRHSLPVIQWPADWEWNPQRTRPNGFLIDRCCQNTRAPCFIAIPPSIIPAEFHGHPMIQNLCHGSPRFRRIAQLFMDSLKEDARKRAQAGTQTASPVFEVKDVFQCMNVDRLQRYRMLKEQTQETIDPTEHFDVGVQNLFHGTAIENLHSILVNGLDSALNPGVCFGVPLGRCASYLTSSAMDAAQCSVARRRNTLIQLANTASSTTATTTSETTTVSASSASATSASATRRNPLEKLVVLVCDAIIGQPEKGRHDQSVASRQPIGRLYHSTWDNPTNPSQYGLWSKEQVLVNYVIVFDMTTVATVGTVAPAFSSEAALALLDLSQAIPTIPTPAHWLSSLSNSSSLVVAATSVTENQTDDQKMHDSCL